MKRFRNYGLLVLLACALPILANTNVGKDLPVEMVPKIVAQGEAVVKWEKDKLYIFECWASWCGPCRSAMKHMEELWQAVKPEGNYVIGLNVMDRLTTEEVTKFLETHSTRVTYTNLVERDNVLTQYLKVNGLPFTFIVRNGKVIWQGHPMKLDLALLRELNEGKTAIATPKAPKLKTPYTSVPAHIALERRADEALAKNLWKDAELLQLEAMRAHPLHGRLQKQYCESGAPVLEERLTLRRAFPTDGTAATSKTGDLAPYAALLGTELPVSDREFTILSYWQPNFTATHYTSETRVSLPGMKEEQRLVYPYYLKVIGEKAHQTIAEQQFAATTSYQANITFIENVNKQELFGYSEKNKPPFVAIFLSGTLIYKGALELLPECLSRNGVRDESMPSAAEWKKRIANDAAHEEELKKRFLTFRKITDNELSIETMRQLCEDSRLGTWEIILMPYRFGPFYQSNDVEGAAELVEKCYKKYYNSEHALEMLNTLIRSWPPLKKRTLKTYSLIAERLAEIQTQGGDDYTAAYYELAGALAQENGDSVRAELMWIKALESSSTGVRYRSIRQRRKPLPAP